MQQNQKYWLFYSSLSSQNQEAYFTHNSTGPFKVGDSGVYYASRGKWSLEPLASSQGSFSYYQT